MMVKSFKHKYTSENDYDILEYRDGKYHRVVGSSLYPPYVAYCQDNTPEIIAYTAPSIAIVSASKKERLEYDYSEYCCSRYPRDNQIWLNSIYSAPDTSAETKTVVEAVWPFMKAILAYKKSKLAEIETAEVNDDHVALEGIEWDFETLTHLDPCVDPEGLLS